MGWWNCIAYPWDRTDVWEDMMVKQLCDAIEQQKPPKPKKLNENTVVHFVRKTVKSDGQLNGIPYRKESLLALQALLKDSRSGKWKVSKKWKEEAVKVINIVYNRISK